MFTPTTTTNLKGGTLLDPTFRDFLAGAALAGLGSLARAWMSTEKPRVPPLDRWSVARLTVGKILAAMIIGMGVGAVASDIWHLSVKLTYAACGVSGLLGEVLVLGAFKSYLSKQLGLTFDKEEKNDSAK